MSPCNIIRLADGTTAYLCGAKLKRQPPCSSCGEPSDYLCDWPIKPRPRPERYPLQPVKPATCDRPLCAKCATEIGPNRHLCPPHTRMQERGWREQGRVIAGGKPTRELEPNQQLRLLVSDDPEAQE